MELICEVLATFIGFGMVIAWFKNGF